MFGKKVLLLSLCTSLMAGCGSFSDEVYGSSRHQPSNPYGPIKADPKFDQGVKTAQEKIKPTKLQLSNVSFARGWFLEYCKLHGITVPTVRNNFDYIDHAQNLLIRIEAAEKASNPSQLKQIPSSDNDRSGLQPHQIPSPQPQPEHKNPLVTPQPDDEPTPAEQRQITAMMQRLSENLSQKHSEFGLSTYKDAITQALMTPNNKATIEDFYQGLEENPNPTYKDQALIKFVSKLGLAPDVLAACKGEPLEDAEYLQFVHSFMKLLIESYRQTSQQIQNIPQKTGVPRGKLIAGIALSACSLAAFIASMKYGLVQKAGSKIASLFKKPEEVKKGFFASTWNAIHEAMSSIYSGVFGK